MLYEDNLIYDIDLSLPMAIVMGSEHKGVNPSVLKIVNEHEDEKTFCHLLSKNLSFLLMELILNFLLYFLISLMLT